MIGTEVTALFMRRCIQPLMSRAHQMWLYSGAKDVTRINAADLSEKELLDEVRRQAHFSQEDTIAMTSAQSPYDIRHLPSAVILLLNNLAIDFTLCTRN
jgi:hypothetical protein